MLAKGINYEDLYTVLRKGLRNGNWRRLSLLDRALYRASLWYSKYRGGIVNGLLVEKLLELIKRLKETRATRIFERGLKKAVEMLHRYKEQKQDGGVFAWAWAPQLKEWLKDPDYIFWLGTVW